MSYAAKLLAVATTHHQAGRLDDAEKAYRKVLKVEAVNVHALRLLGGLYLQTKQWDKAAENLEKAARFRTQDPETLTNLGVALRGLGRLDEAVARYQQALEIAPDYPHALANLGTLYQETGQAALAVQVFAQALNFAPESAAAQYNYGNALYRSGRMSEAVPHYEQALRLKPDYLEAMVNLGMTLSQMGKSNGARQWLEEAKVLFERVLHAEPQNIVALNNLGNVLRQQDKPQEAAELYWRALQLRPDYVEAAINLATALRDLNRMEEAIASCNHALHLNPTAADAHTNLGTFMQELARHEEAVTHFSAALMLNPSSPDAKWNKALSLLSLGNYDEGLALHEVGLGIAHMRGEYPSPEKRWNGENFAGKRLLLWCEQGLGDSLQFIRYAALCKERGGTVIVLCPRALRKLFANCSVIDALPESLEAEDFDLHAPLMSLPYIFGTTVGTIPADIPYLCISAAAREKWAGKMPNTGRFRIGLVWAGNPREGQSNAHRIDRRRSMNLEMLRPLFALEGIDFYNLQMGASAPQIDICGVRNHFVDLMPEVRNFEDTGAIIEQLDLVISVDTSVAHLAGGLGRPVWVLSRFDACWRWLQNRPENPWYPSARVFGQTTEGDWAGVVKRVRGALEIVLISRS